jgi:hypothetical protein
VPHHQPSQITPTLLDQSRERFDEVDHPSNPKKVPT